ncbi:hypothetical protein GHT06_009286 [Daphnia sinensis]|uniref:Methyltransferase domain-containing protein n=1 Tax=Daphnia sinensis TaxID=1820382 RepID=A0AAD5L585_9CRUS|nr:hypothetical protein GHT06_009286 [Daphnia sinensis]
MEVNMDKKYAEDWKNFCDHGDIGDDWCSEEVVQAILTWIKTNIEFDDPILDIGCGNAAFIFQMYHKGYTNVTGIDKSPNAIKLATEISHQECVKVRLEVCDVLGPVPSDTPDSPLNKRYRLVLDKGLYDSVVLDTSTEGSQTKTEQFRDNYVKRTYELLQPGGILLVATCCHTEEEMKKTIGKNVFDVLEVLPTPTFEFGGKKGHNVTVVAFRRKD